MLQAFAEHARDGASVASIDASANGFLERGGIIELEPVAGERCISTRELLQLEHAALERASRPLEPAVTEHALTIATACRRSPWPRSIATAL